MYSLNPEMPRSMIIYKIWFMNYFRARYYVLSLLSIYLFKLDFHVYYIHVISNITNVI